MIMLHYTKIVQLKLSNVFRNSTDLISMQVLNKILQNKILFSRTSTNILQNQTKSYLDR